VEQEVEEEEVVFGRGMEWTRMLEGPSQGSGLVQAQHCCFVDSDSLVLWRPSISSVLSFVVKPYPIVQALSVQAEALSVGHLDPYLLVLSSFGHECL
jgi:hypothetical protein